LLILECSLQRLFFSGLLFALGLEGVVVVLLLLLTLAYLGRFVGVKFFQEALALDLEGLEAPLLGV